MTITATNHQEEMDFLNHLTKPGREISINIVIHNQEQARKLLSTLNNKDPSIFGFIVTCWGSGNLLAENDRKKEEIADELRRHFEKMHALMHAR